MSEDEIRALLDVVAYDVATLPSDTAEWILWVSAISAASLSMVGDVRALYGAS